MHTTLSCVLSVAAVCQVTQRVWFFSDLFSSSFQRVWSQLTSILISRCAASHKSFLKTEYKRVWNVLETYGITGILGSKRLETELVKFHCLEFVKAKLHRAVMPSFHLASSSMLENFFSFNIFAAGVQSLIIKNNAIFETYPPNLDYYRCFSSI